MVLLIFNTISAKRREFMKKVLIALLFVVSAAIPVYAQMDGMPMHDRAGHGHEGQGPMMEMGGMDHMGDMMGACLDNADKIGLTDEQVKKLTPIHREMKKKLIRSKADIKIAEMELMDIMEVKDFDLEKATAAVKKIADMKAAHHIEMLKSMKEVRSVLTEEQFQKMKKLHPMKKGTKAKQKKMMKK
jgi:Spy/CpxP family protein refolding chaperone